MEILHEEKAVKYVLYKYFKNQFLLPIGEYVQWKLEHNWDDYNELFHATRLIENIKGETNVWFETHSIIRNEKYLGILLIVGGDINNIERKYKIENENKSLLLKYFHVVEKGKGHGSFWLNSIIIPYYQAKGFKKIYVNSSHPISFPFYNKLGSEIATYKQTSDNGLYQREGSCFLISI